jgi:[acyl-carrier-protein] S-malonyltransferase
MGKDLAERFSEARDVFQAVDEALEIPLSRVMWQGQEAELTLTHNAQPAILAHSLAVWAVVGGTLDPAVAAGHSLGEYSAYAAAGALKFASAAQLVRRRGELMLEAGRQRCGTMAAVIGVDAEQVERVCREASGAGQVVVPANLNAPDQTVISGDPEPVERAAKLLRDRGAKRVLQLKVSGAFHSPLMEPARAGLAEELERVSFDRPAFPVIANSTALPVTDSDDARRGLCEQVTEPVRWVESMQRAAGHVGEADPFVEIWPGKVLKALLRRIVTGRTAIAVGGVEEVTAFLEEHA